MRHALVLLAALALGACGAVGTRSVVTADSARQSQPGLNRATQVDAADGRRVSDAASTVPQTWVASGDLSSIGPGARLTGTIDLSTPEAARRVLLDSGGTARVRIERLTLPMEAGTVEATGLELSMSSAEAARAQNEALGPITAYLSTLTQQQRAAIEAVAPGLFGLLERLIPR